MVINRVDQVELLRKLYCEFLERLDTRTLSCIISGGLDQMVHWVYGKTKP